MTSTGNNSVGGSLTSTGQWRSDGYRTPLTAKIERAVGRRAIDVTCLVAPGRDQPAPSVRGHGHVGQCWVMGHVEPCGSGGAMSPAEPCGAGAMGWGLLLSFVPLPPIN